MLPHRRSRFGVTNFDFLERLTNAIGMMRYALAYEAKIREIFGMPVKEETKVVSPRGRKRR